MTIRTIKKAALAITVYFFFTPFLHAQDSIIEKMMEIQKAVVEITAENIDFYSQGKASAGIDPVSRRIIVARKAAGRSYRRAGAGVIIHSDGLIVTNAHTGYKANVIRVTLDSGETFYAQPVRLVNDLDLLLLKINAGRPLPYVSLADSDQIKLNQNIITIGNSDFLKKTITGGTIIGIGISRKLKHGGNQRTDLIQTSINLYRGDSGGPLFNSYGQLLGLMTADESAADHSSFAIPSNKIQKYLIEYLQ